MDETMSIQQILEYRQRRNRFCNRLGISLTELRPGHAASVKAVTEEDLNPLGFAHGGVYFTVADNVAGAAMAAHGHQAVTLNAQYNYFRSVTAGDTIHAEADEVKHGETISVYDVRLTDQNGTLVGTGTFTFYDLKTPLDIDG